MNSKTILAVGGIAAVGYFALGASDAAGGTSGGSDAGEAILAGETPDPDTYGSGDTLEDAETTGTTPAGLTGTRNGFESVLEEIPGGYETPTRRAGGHLM